MQFMYLIGKHEGNIQIAGPRIIWEDNIKMNLIDVQWDSMDWIHTVQNRDQLPELCARGNEHLAALTQTISKKAYWKVGLHSFLINFLLEEEKC